MFFEIDYLIIYENLYLNTVYYLLFVIRLLVYE